MSGRRPRAPGSTRWGSRGAATVSVAGQGIGHDEVAYAAWRRGEVNPAALTMALDLRGLYGPQVDLACGVEEPAVDQWEAAALYPSWEQLQALAVLTAFDVRFFVRPLAPQASGFLCVRGGRGKGCHPLRPRDGPVTFDVSVVAQRAGTDAHCGGAPASSPEIACLGVIPEGDDSAHHQVGKGRQHVVVRGLRRVLCDSAMGVAVNALRHRCFQ